jgi:glycosyltransferase involved in cell wall biosynthesis
MDDPAVSIIIRSKNEERWITRCLQAVTRQTYTDYEIILVDNESRDGTVRKAEAFPVKVVTIGEYFPGKAMNVGVRASKGRYLVFLSAHCIPTGPGWLEALIKGFDNEKAAGVYGRQQPMTFSSPQDKRDLTISFGLDRRVQWKDPFFHNANSAVRRDIWEKFPFDETVSNIEDRLWAETVQAQGYCIQYEPDASVYHHHGIHQDNKEDRLETTVKVLEGLHANNRHYENGQLKPADQRIAAFIPIRGESPLIGDKPVLQFTLTTAARSGFIDETLVLTDNQNVADYAREHNAAVPFLRDSKYSRDEVDLNSVYAYCLKRLEEQGWTADIIVCMEPTYPFRPPGLIDDLVVQFLEGGYDSVIPVKAEYNSCWLETEKRHKPIYDGETPRHLRSPLLVGLKGLGCVTYPEFLRQGRLLGDNVGLVRISDPIAAMEVRTQYDHELVKLVQQKDQDER